MSRQHGHTDKNWDRDEDSFTKQLDARLFRRLLAYAGPHRPLIALTALALAVSTTADLSVPYILKVCIDEHLEVKAALVDTSVLAREQVEAVAAAAGAEFPALAADPGGRRILTHRGFRLLPLSLLRQLEKTGALSAREYYVFGADSEAKTALAEQHPGLFLPLPGAYAIRFSDLSALGPEALSTVRSRDFYWVTFLGLTLVGMLIVRFVLYFGSFLGVQWAGQQITHRMRMQVFSHLQKMSLRFFDRKPVGTLVTRGTVDIKVLEEMFIGVLLNLFTDFYMLAGLVGMMLYLDWKLSLAAFVVIPLLVIATLSFRRLAREAYRLVRAKVARINAFFAENVAGMAIVQVFNRQAENLRMFREINQEHFRARLRELYVFAVFRPLVEVLSALAIGLVLWYGGLRTLSDAITLGTLVAFVTYVQKFFQPIQDLSEKYNLMQAAMASSERVFQVLDEPLEIANPDKPVTVRDPQGKVEFRHVWFAYEGEDWVLRDANFVVEPGTSLALVGPTGAGKSTIVNLLGRYYDAVKGEILVDGTDVRRLDKAWLRSQIGMVMQDVFLFTGDIKSNIRLRNKDITDDAVVRAAEHVMASRFIERLPNRYVEIVKERGSTLSAGERQLLAFARALAFDPRILVLDEATASVDSETERLIQEALEKLMEMRTSIIIAHRLSTVKNVDRILVLQEGRIVEAGSHAELLAAGGLYRKLYETQAASSI